MKMQQCYTILLPIAIVLIITNTYLKSIKQAPKNIQNCTALQKIHESKSFSIIKLTSIEDTLIQIMNRNTYFNDAQSLLDDFEYSIKFGAKPFFLQENEYFLFKFNEPQIMNLLKLYIRVKKLGYEVEDCEFDKFQIRKLKIVGIYRHRETKLIETSIWNKTNVLIRNSVNNRKYLSVYILCRKIQCQNAYRQFKIYFTSLLNETHVYPMAMYHINNIDLIQINQLPQL